MVLASGVTVPSTGVVFASPLVVAPLFFVVGFVVDVGARDDVASFAAVVVLPAGVPSPAVVVVLALVLPSFLRLVGTGVDGFAVVSSVDA